MGDDKARVLLLPSNRLLWMEGDDWEILGGDLPLEPTPFRGLAAQATAEVANQIWLEQAISRGPR